MSIRVYKVEDTAGDRWHICPGDQAHPLCDRLTKTGWDAIRLPWPVLATGDITPDVVSSARSILGVMIAGMELMRDVPPEQQVVIDQALLEEHDTVKQLEELVCYNRHALDNLEPSHPAAAGGGKEVP